MSRIGKKSIKIPSNVSVELDGAKISVKGSKGELNMKLHDSVKVDIKDGEIFVNKKRNSKISQMMWGTTQRLISNMIIGVSEGFKKTLLLEGVGYRIALKGKQLDLALGFSHPVLVDIPSDVNVEVDKMKIVISGADKQKVGQFAAEIRALKPVEPYKGKGFRYEGEVVRRKEGKRAVAG